MQVIKFIVLLWSISGLNGARITGLDVPKVALVGDEIKLRCDYDESDGSRLYSLKWYKDGQEFYRHVPGSKQSTSQGCTDSQSHSWPMGITVDCWESSEKEVILKDLNVKTSGEFKCEVIGDHPAFRREEREARLTVYREPLVEPVIAGNSLYYEIGDSVSLNCTSKNHEYVPTLTWFVNGKPPLDYETLRPRSADHTSIGLFFTATPLKFVHGRLDVTCRATMGPNHSESTEIILSIPGLLLPQYYSSAIQRNRLKELFGIVRTADR